MKKIKKITIGQPGVNISFIPESETTLAKTGKEKYGEIASSFAEACIKTMIKNYKSMLKVVAAVEAGESANDIGKKIWGKAWETDVIIKRKGKVTQYSCFGIHLYEEEDQSYTKFYGPDKSNEISLMECGLLVSEDKNEKGEHKIVYRVNNGFAIGYISEAEVDKIVSKDSRVEKSDIAWFFPFVGESKTEWLKNTFVAKLQDIIAYWGPLNVFGDPPTTMTEEEVRMQFL